MRRLPFFLQNLLILFTALAVCMLPAWAIYRGTTTFSGLSVTNNAAVGGNLTVTGTTTQTGAVTFTAKPTLSTGTIGANSDTYTIPDVGDASFVMTAGTQTIAGAKTFSTAPTITGGLTAANIQTGSAKRIVERVQLSPVTGAAADSTTYAGLVSFCRAGTVKKISFACTVAPTVGTDTIEVLKNNTTTLLSTATYDANSLTALTKADATLTATTGDLSLAATDVIRCKYNAGSQTVDAQDVTAFIEFELTDF